LQQDFSKTGRHLIDRNLRYGIAFAVCRKGLPSWREPKLIANAVFDFGVLIGEPEQNQACSFTNFHRFARFFSFMVRLKFYQLLDAGVFQEAEEEFLVHCVFLLSH
jgi:hypothetical protein